MADGSEPRFNGDAQNFLDQFSDEYETALVPQIGEGRETSKSIINEINSGVLIFSYFGHGSIIQLGKVGLFTTDDAAGLNNGLLTPIMVNITCLAGLFTHPTVESLSEVMLWNETGGTVASLGATSLTLPEYQAYLSDGFAQALSSFSDQRLGDLFFTAQLQMPIEVGVGAKEVLDTFLLFGDPALILPSP